MKSRGVLAVAAVATLVVLSGCLGGSGVGLLDGGQHTDGPPTTTDVERTVNATFVVDGAENVSVSLEVANSPDERRTGLMHRESLPERHGMVFVFEDAAPRSFWMKNTYVPLDMVFVGPEKRVLNVEHASPGANVSESNLDTYRSEGDAKYVVELPRGFANRTGVSPGDRFVVPNATLETEGSD